MKALCLAALLLACPALRADERLLPVNLLKFTGFIVADEGVSFDIDYVGCDSKNALYFVHCSKNDLKWVVCVPWTIVASENIDAMKQSYRQALIDVLAFQKTEDQAVRKAFAAGAQAEREHLEAQGHH